jgi:hypothetical protein
MKHGSTEDTEDARNRPTPPGKKVLWVVVAGFRGCFRVFRASVV